MKKGLTENPGGLSPNPTPKTPTVDGGGFFQGREKRGKGAEEHNVVRKEGKTILSKPVLKGTKRGGQRRGAPQRKGKRDRGNGKKKMGRLGIKAWFTPEKVAISESCAREKAKRDPQGAPAGKLKGAA